MTLDLLRERLIQTDAGWHSLPGLLAAMAHGAVQGFPALRPHQRPAWHMFLVQLSVLALDAAGHRDLPADEETWREALRALTPGFPEDDPWHLIGVDRTRPAFLQPADPGGLKWSEVATPDALDMLITSRNHDVKREIARKAAPQDWIFALVSLQTMEGYGGGGGRLNGIARMNKGNSSRVLLGLAPCKPYSTGVDPATWWSRDTKTLLDMFCGDVRGGLIWVFPWPEGKTVDISKLHPLFIEVCRRIRLDRIGERIFGRKSTSSQPRTSASELKGNTGDPWATVHLTDGKSLTLGDRDWTHQLLFELLFKNPPEWSVPPLAQRQARDANGSMLLVAEAFARGNSKTDGFKSRVVPVPLAMVRDLFGERPKAIAPGVLNDIAAISSSLSDALELVATLGDKERRKNLRAKPTGRDKLNKFTAAAREALRRHADQLFFPELWARMAATSEAEIAPVRAAFLDRLAQHAREEFVRALPAIPCASLMRPRAEARGRQALEYGLAKAMSDLKPEDAHVEA
jgi:CRISPR system Cascade subunit CasA